MLIRCPNCHFDREIDAAKIPPNAMMATCPRCGERFRFRNSDGTPVFVEPAVDRDAAPPAPANPPEPAHPAVPAPARPSEGRRPAAPSAASPQEEHPEDDPLPPGAVTIRAPEDAAKPRAESSPPDGGPAADDEGSGKEPASRALREGPDGRRANSGREQRESDAERPSFLDALRHAASKAREKGRPAPPASLRSGETERRDDDAGKMDIPWEQPRRYGLAAGLYQTVLRVMFNAPRFFAGVGEATGSLVRPLVFYLILGVFQTLVERMWFHMSIEASAPSITDPKLQEMLGAMAQSMSLPLTLILSPVLLTIQLGFFAGVFFLMIRLVQPDRASYPILFRVVAYSAAPTVVCIVPLVGPLAGSLWFAICCLVGCKHALALPWSRTLLALGPLYAIAFAIGLQVVRQLLGG